VFVYVAVLAKESFHDWLYVLAVVSKLAVVVPVIGFTIFAWSLFSGATILTKRPDPDCSTWDFELELKEAFIAAVFMKEV
jgi:hypothetical protein